MIVLVLLLTKGALNPITEESIVHTLLKLLGLLVSR